MTTSKQHLAAFNPSTPYPEPIIVPPRELPHKQSVIICHGRGDTAKNFAPLLLMTNIPGYGTLPEAFPHARFVFPSAAPRPAAAMKDTPVSQWYDLHSIKQQEVQQEIQIEGLRESSEWLHILMLKEIEMVGAGNLVLGGLSQGCATALIASLLWEGPGIAGVFGMCGLLPLRLVMAEEAGMVGELEKRDAEGEEKLKEDIAKGAQKMGNDSTSQHDVKLETAKALEAATVATAVHVADDQGPRQVRAGLRAYLGLPATTIASNTFKNTPLFLGHGWLDQMVPPQLGRRAADFFKILGTDVTYKEYRDLGHWYSPDMLKDIAHFLRDKVV